MKHATPAIRQNAVAENFKNRSLYVAPEIIGLHADVHLDLQRHKSWRVHFQIVPRHSKALDRIANAVLEGIVHKETAETIHREKDSVPATGPTKCPGGALDTPIALRDFGVIGLGDRAFLRAKCGRRALANILDRFRLDPALRRHWISNGRDLLQIRDNMRERFSAYVSRDAVADAISRTELRARFGPLAQQIVAEPKICRAVRINLYYEFWSGRAAVEQIAFRMPRWRTRVRFEKNLRRRASNVPTHRRRGRRTGIKRRRKSQWLIFEKRTITRRNCNRLGFDAGIANRRRLENCWPRNGVGNRRIGFCQSVVAQHDVAARDANGVAEIFLSVLLIGARRNAKWKRQCVLIAPFDSGKFFGVKRIHTKHRLLGEPHSLTVRRVGVAGLAGAGAEDLFEDEHLALLQIGKMAVQLRAGCGLRQTATLFGPGIKIHFVVRLEQHWHFMHCFETGLRLSQNSRLVR